MVGSLLRWIVLTRDNFICQNCAKKGERSPWRNYDLDAHHIDGNRENNSYDNLITLCDDCHFEIHGCNWKNKPIKTFKSKTTTNEIIRQAEQSWYASCYGTETIETEDLDIS